MLAEAPIINFFNMVFKVVDNNNKVVDIYWKKTPIFKVLAHLQLQRLTRAHIPEILRI